MEPGKLELLAERLPGHDVQLVTDEYAFIYSGSGEYVADLYIILLCEGVTRVHHQYGCVCCDQFDMENCALIAINGPLAEQLSEAMGCNPDAEKLQELVRQFLPDATVSYPTEAFVSVSSDEFGSFTLASNNCD